MGGLAGAITPQPRAGPLVERMLAALAHRGALRTSALAQPAPGVAAEVGCLHARARSAARPPPLARLAGHLLAYDGWISNGEELRRELLSEQAPVAQASVAELLLHALLRWGQAAFARVHGSWALVCVDGPRQCVWLARDALGSKPLYLLSGADGCLFASEIKGILLGAGRRFGIDAEMVAAFLAQTLLDVQPRSFFAGIRPVPAGHAVRLDCARPAPWDAAPVAYWRIPERDAFVGSEAERIAAVREHVHAAVRRQLPGGERVGLLVSGGLDSSAVAAAACAAPQGSELVLLSGAGPPGSDPMLDSLCRHLGRETHRVSMLLHAPEALRELEHVIGCNDEPVRGFDIVVDHRLKGAARDLGVEVLMGGLGSDELFAGKLVHLVFHVQSLLRSRRFLEAARFVGAIVRNRTLRPRFRLAAQKRYFPRLDRAAIELRGPVLRAHPCRYELGLGSRSCHERLLLELTSLSLPALLHYDDRTTSASGLESRYALLDPPLVELVAPMAPAWKLRTGHSKWLLRKAMEPELPREICWRKLLQPVGDAHGSWLKRDLHAQVEALLAGELASVELGLLDRDGLRRHYAAFCRQAPGAGAISARDVFSWLAIEIWCRRFAAHLRPEPSA